MSYLEAKVREIHQSDTLHIVKFEYKKYPLYMMSLELDRTKIKEGVSVMLNFKPTHIALSKQISVNISFVNQLPVIIKRIYNGKLLSYIELDFFDKEIESIITKKACEDMKLKEGDGVVALINASEISILEVL